ncbi:uncharacterized protein B0I36DRAFT_338286 [Microdochium trichocladiopsis]|uniref:Uncharacterized protein n=1 Tax=Microdochium trichocladiopsis TaxID=1682393 RepID=A0A9P9BI73_9PEZI|nr:uncharacterized protein B0I36DRAFT_338286 [Microdochium trichocladiopsis]KAH7014118.1 hypothetical protein B0I36DRAFT_338286 [Microdochium trichocladiopsis]
MHFKALLASAALLAGTATAIDVHLHYHRCTEDSSSWCTNLEPNTCCQSLVGAGYGSASFRAIPSNWELELRLHQGERKCENVLISGRSWGQTYVCLPAPGSFHGAGYGFFGKKARGEEHEVQSEACQRVDKLRLADGTIYTLEDLDDAQFTEINQFAAAGGNSTDLPEHFSKYRV